jgi:hypothetical protein
MEWEIQAYHKNNKKNTVSLGQLKKNAKISRSPILHKRGKNKREITIKQQQWKRSTGSL